MPKFRKKPEIIDAFHWNGEEVPGYRIMEQAFGANCVYARPDKDWAPLEYSVRYLVIPTRQYGELFASVGNWVLATATGEQTTCSDEYFRANYEPVE